MGTFGDTPFGGSAASGTSSITPTTAGDLLYAALRKAGVVLAANRVPSAGMFTEALKEINRMIGGWNCSPLLIFTNRIDIYPLTESKTYTIGQDPTGETTADFDSPRPQRIVRANVLFPGTPSIRRKVNVLTDQKWSDITLQDVANGVPLEMYNDAAYPLSTISIHPQTTSGYQLELYTWQAIAKFTSADDIVLLPDGYEDAIVNCGALRLASLPWPVQRKIDPQVKVDAQSALARLQSLNATVPRIRTDEGNGGGGFYNYLTGLMDN